MPMFGPIKRKELIRCLRQCGYMGPLSGGKHEYMVMGDFRLTIPNPHKGDISASLLAQILKRAGISREEWEKL